MNKIAYLLLVHNDIDHCERLVDSLDHNSDFFIHIDSKTKIDEFAKRLEGRNNITLIKDRVPVYWGGFNMIEATKKLLKISTESSYEYIRHILLSGADYPLVSNEGIHSFFEKNKGIEFIRGFNISKSNSRHYLNQVERIFIMDKIIINHLVTRVFRKLVSCFRVKKPFILTESGKMDVFFGSQWWAISGKCAKEMLGVIQSNPQIDKYFQHSFAPDEKYFHTVFFQTSYKNNNQDGGEGPYKGRGTYKWSNLHLIHASLSKYYTIQDIDEVMGSSNLFIRKVSTDISNELLNEIDKKRTLASN
ncbi:hypothetical protein A8709_23005 [Paenibacillus pectinilyticus]|uniref:Peptide O-xylosyltransferase n=1 Tax=Paenibacillus pectinilyticus TaxID=512399 RepID=A0A1C0ZRL8_9BACL|nr:beta-1,6-N-acetylglucosaminyltransferase [Paenibacillus pectinilyticus]OCT10709.1 hypothetical protein A8709_23005 [Paenibacillus pectinilyticus]